jgi:NADH dehydrogenase
LFADRRNVELVIDEVVKLDSSAKTVSTKGRHKVAYDYLVLALGVVTNYFGIEGLDEFSHSIKSIEGAERFKRQLHHDLAVMGRPDSNYVVVGGGPTGVELSAALGGYMRQIARGHGIRRPHIHIDLVEAAPRVLPRSSEAVSKAVTRRLRRLGVKVMTGVTVMGETATKLQLKDHDISTHTVVWTAGVSNHPFFAQHPKVFTLSPKGGRVEVDEHLQAAEGVYVLGDNAKTLYSGLAETAVSDAGYVASDIKRQLDGKNRVPYRPKRPLPVTPVGDRWAVLEWGNLHLTGYPAWLLRRVADLLAYRYIESWPRALKVWLQDWRREDQCPICQPTTRRRLGSSKTRPV